MIRAEGFAKTTKNYARTFIAAVSQEEYAVRQISGKNGLNPDSVVSIVSALIDQAAEPMPLLEALIAMLEEKRRTL